MSKTNYAITEIITNGFGELQEIAVITVDMATREITGTFSARVKTKLDTTNALQKPTEPLLDTLPIEEVLPIVMRMLQGKKLASHTGLDFEGEYLNKLFAEYYGFEKVIERVNVIDAHVLIMRFHKGVNPNMLEAASHFGVKPTRLDNALLKAYMTYGILKKIFEDGAIRQHTYKYAFKALNFPEVKVEPVIVEVEKIVNIPVEVEKIVYIELTFWETIKKRFSKKH